MGFLLQAVVGGAPGQHLDYGSVGTCSLDIILVMQYIIAANSGRNPYGSDGSNAFSKLLYKVFTFACQKLLRIRSEPRF